jgi:predicted dehydrogenase
MPASTLGKDGHVAPSNRVVMAAIGTGGRAMGLLGWFMAHPEARFVAVCDCFADRRKRSKSIVDNRYGNKDCATTRFHEEILARDDVDAVLIGTGDRWHTPLSILAAKAGKDVYC